MNIQLNINKIKKISNKNKKIYIICDDFQVIHGRVEEIGNLYVYIKTENQVEPIPIEIEKIKNISSHENTFYKELINQALV